MFKIVYFPANFSLCRAQAGFEPLTLGLEVEGSATVLLKTFLRASCDYYLVRDLYCKRGYNIFV
jgi:hypothetical protein